MNLFQTLEVAGSDYQSKINSPLKWGIDKTQCPLAYQNAKRALEQAKKQNLIFSQAIEVNKRYGAFQIIDRTKRAIYMVALNDRYCTIGRKFAEN